MQYAKKSSLAGRSGAVIDGDTVYVPSTLTLSKASSHIPLTVDSANDRLAFTLGGKAMTSGWKPRLRQPFRPRRGDKREDGGGKRRFNSRGEGKRGLACFHRRTEGRRRKQLLSLQHLPAEQAENNPRRINSPYYNPATGNAETPAKITLSSVDSLPLTIDSSGSSNNYITIDYTYPKTARYPESSPTDSRS